MPGLGVGGGYVPPRPVAYGDYSTPIVQPRPLTVADVERITGFSAAPTSAYGFGDAGPDFADAIGSNTLERVPGSGGQFQLPGYGLYPSPMVAEHDDLALAWDLASTTPFQVSTGPVSFALIYRMQESVAANGAFMGNMSAGFVGWQLRQNGNSIRYECGDGITTNQLTQTVGNKDGAWHCMVGGVIANTVGGLVLESDFGSASLDTTVTPAASGVSFGIGKITAGANNAFVGLQIALLILWEGAPATTIRSNAAAVFGNLWKHGGDPSALIDRSIFVPTVIPATRWDSGDADDYALATWSQNAASAIAPTDRQIPVGYHPAITKGAGCGLYRSNPWTQLVDRTDALEHADWTKVGAATVSAAIADMMPSPRGFHEARKITIPTAASDYVSRAFAVVASTEYTIDAFVLDSDGDTPEIELWDASNVAQIATVNAGALSDSKWRKLSHTFTTPVGCTSLEIRWRATADSADYWGSRANLYSGARRDASTYQAGASGSVSLIEQHGDLPAGTVGLMNRGSIGTRMVLFPADREGGGATRCCSVNNSVSTTARRGLLLGASNDNPRAEARDDGGGVIHAAITDAGNVPRDTEFTVEHDWRYDIADGIRSGVNAELWRDGVSRGTAAATAVLAVEYDRVQIGSHSLNTPPEGLCVAVAVHARPQGGHGI